MVLKILITILEVLGKGNIYKDLVRDFLFVQ